MIFWGPPGTGKTLFAKAMATAHRGGDHRRLRPGAEEQVGRRERREPAPDLPPGPAVGPVDHRLRRARLVRHRPRHLHRLRRRALDGQPAPHRDGRLPQGGAVFVVGTTNFVEILDPALLRPGRFEFHLHIPYPDADDRRDDPRIYDRKMRLQMTPEALDYAVKRTADSSRDGAGHALQRRPPQRPVPGGRPHAAAREHHAARRTPTTSSGR